MTHVLLDIGNTRIKWGVWQDGGLRSTGMILQAQADDAAQWAFANSATRAVACNVAGDERAEIAAQQLHNIANVELELARTTAECAGVRCAYAQPRRLGVDRWMAVLAASRLGDQPALVVDAGTALTIDALDRNQQHLGGYIIPGLNLMQQALTRRTADIRIDQPEPLVEQFGATTSDAVRNGALTALAGAIVRAADQLAERTDTTIDSIRFAFTGGDGTLLAEALDRADAVRPNLVLEGLAIYAEQHQ